MEEKTLEWEATDMKRVENRRGVVKKDFLRQQEKNTPS